MTVAGPILLNDSVSFMFDDIISPGTLLKYARKRLGIKCACVRCMHANIFNGNLLAIKIGVGNELLRSLDIYRRLWRRVL